MKPSSELQGEREEEGTNSVEKNSSTTRLNSAELEVVRVLALDSVVCYGGWVVGEPVSAGSNAWQLARITSIGLL